MKHLYNYSVCQPIADLPGKGKDLSSERCDGLELFTLFEEVPREYFGLSPSVHLPFAIDWYSVWKGTADISEFDEENVKYVAYGRDREEIIKNLTSGIRYASAIDPAYGVLHAGNTNLDEVMHRTQVDNSRDILREFCEIMNRVVSEFRNGEPPFKLAFENLWWPGLKLAEPWEYEFMDKHLEFSNWGFCLDTGHLMNTLDDAYEEEHSIERLLEIFHRYPDEMKERIGTIHLQLSTSAEYRNTFETEDRPAGSTMQETIARTYPHISKIDQHRPFSSPKCRLLVEELSPEFVTHEMMGPSFSDFKKQRSLFPA